MRSKVYKQEAGYILARVYPFKSSFTDISVSRSRDLTTMKFGKSEINWPAVGSKDIKTTETFIKGLQEAVRIAKNLQKARLK